MTGKSELHLQSPNPTWDTPPAYTSSVTIDLRSDSGLRLDLLRELKRGSLPANSQYLGCTTGILLFPGTGVRIFHGRRDHQYALQVASSYSICRHEVELCRQQLFADARNVRVLCLEICFKVREIGAGWNGRNGTARSAHQLENGKRDRPQFRLNAVGLPWHAETDNGAGLLRVRVVLDRAFLTGCGIATLRDVVGLRQLRLDALLSRKDICQLPVPFNFSTSREVLAERLQRMLAGFFF
jgi:hypothetical protein